MFFGGAPLWHASVVLWSMLTRRPRLVTSWSEEDHRKAERYAMDALRGVGIEDRTRADPHASGMHWRRETTARERDYVFKTAGGRAAARRHQIGG